MIIMQKSLSIIVAITLIMGLVIGFGLGSISEIKTEKVTVTSLKTTEITTTKIITSVLTKRVVETLLLCAPNNITVKEVIMSENVKNPENALGSADGKFAIMGGGNGWVIYDFGITLRNCTITFIGEGDGVIEVYGGGEPSLDAVWKYYGNKKMGERVEGFSGRYILLKDVKPDTLPPWIVLIDSIAACGGC